MGKWLLYACDYRPSQTGMRPSGLLTSIRRHTKRASSLPTSPITDHHRNKAPLSHASDHHRESSAAPGDKRTKRYFLLNLGIYIQQIQEFLLRLTVHSWVSYFIKYNWWERTRVQNMRTEASGLQFHHNPGPSKARMVWGGASAK